MAASSRVRAATPAPPQIKNGGINRLVTLEGIKSLVSAHWTEKEHRLVGRLGESREKESKETEQAIDPS